MVLRKKQLFVSFPWVVTSIGPGGFMVCVFFYDGNSRRLNRKWFYGGAGNRTCDPWLQDIGLSPTLGTRAGY